MKKWGLNEPSSEIKREPKGEVSEKRSFIEYRVRVREKQLCLKWGPNVVEMESVTQLIAC